MLQIVHEPQRDISLGRVTGLDLHRMFMDKKIAPGSTVQAKITEPGLYTGLDPLHPRLCRTRQVGP